MNEAAGAFRLTVRTAVIRRSRGHALARRAFSLSPNTPGARRCNGSGVRAPPVPGPHTRRVLARRRRRLEAKAAASGLAPVCPAVCALALAEGLQYGGARLTAVASSPGCSLAPEGPPMTRKTVPSRVVDAEREARALGLAAGGARAARARRRGGGDLVVQRRLGRVVLAGVPQSRARGVFIVVFLIPAAAGEHSFGVSSACDPLARLGLALRALVRFRASAAGAPGEACVELRSCARGVAAVRRTLDAQCTSTRRRRLRLCLL